MKFFIFMFTFVTCVTLSKEAAFIPAPVSSYMSGRCEGGACDMTLCIKNLQNKKLTIGSPFLGEDQLLVNGMIFYRLEDYIKAGSDIYSPWLKRDSMKNFFKENYLKGVDSLVSITFESREEKCFTVNLEKSYIFEDGKYYIGHHILQEAFVLEGNKKGFFSISSNVLVIQKASKANQKAN